MPVPGPRSERRNLAILFADLCDSTRLAGALEPEDYSALLEQLRSVQAAVIARHGGIVVRIDGDGMTCAFGYPAALDDAGRRATEAALDLHAAMARIEPAPADRPLQMHSGIHAGVVLVRAGDLVRGSIEILGDATNVAARLCDAAAAGEIMVSRSCLGSDRHFFETGPERAVAISGRKTAIAAVPVAGRSRITTRYAARHQRGMMPFCGRTRELALLHKALRASGAGATGHVILEGPAGIGKTRLLSEFLNAAEQAGVKVHRGYCEAYLGARPLQAFEQIVEALGGTGSAASDVSQAMQRWAQALAGPTVLAIDDWQWADDASHTLIAEIRRAAAAPLMILLATRPEPVPAPDDGQRTMITVGPLGDADAERAIDGLLRTSDPFEVERIRRRAGGSPLFIEELCHARATGVREGDLADGDAWLESLVQARFDALAPEPAQLVRIASVIGHMIPTALFAALTGIGPNHPVLEDLGASDFLYPGEVEGTLRFKHALTRDAIYRIIGLEERQQLHALVAERLEAFAGQEGDGEYVDALAYHHAACGHDRQAIDYATRAGDRAMAIAALDRAQAQYRLALDLAGRGGIDRPVDAGLLTSLIVKFGRASVVDPSAEQLETLTAAAALAARDGNREGVTMAEYWLGAINYGLGNAGESIRHLEAVRSDPSVLGRPGFAAQLLGNLGQSHAIASNYAQARRFLDASIASKRGSRSDGTAATGLAYSLASRAYLDAVQGHFPAAHAGFADARAALHGTYHPVISSIAALHALSCIAEHDFEACLRHIGEAITIGSQSRARYIVVSCRAVQNYANWAIARDAAFADALVANTAWQVASNSRQRLSNNFGWLTTIMATNGRASDARRYFEAACARADEGDRLGEADACRAMARLAAATGAPADWQPLLDRAYRSAELRDAPRERHETDLCAAEIWDGLGRDDAAQAALQRAIAGFRSLGMDRRLAGIRPALAANP